VHHGLDAALGEDAGDLLPVAEVAADELDAGGAGYLLAAGREVVVGRRLVTGLAQRAGGDAPDVARATDDEDALRWPPVLSAGRAPPAGPLQRFRNDKTGSLRDGDGRVQRNGELFARWLALPRAPPPALAPRRRGAYTRGPGGS